MKFLLTINKDSSELEKVVKSGEILSFSAGTVLMEEDTQAIASDQKILFHDGYLRDLNLNPEDLRQDSILGTLSEEWPLPSNITGSFSALLIDKAKEHFVLANDNIGLYPLYFLKNKSGFYCSNSIIWLGRASGAEFDDAGIAQRCLGPLFENLGRRTILTDCKRLLPGECLRFDFKGNLISKSYDNSLYKNMTSPNQDHDLWIDYWTAYQKEIEYCTNYSKKVNVALSGGIDSRLILGAIPNSKEITCYTFGKQENYESKVAKKLAEIKGADFVSCWKPEVYFPKRKTLEKYTYQTEGVQLCSWLEITEKINDKRREPLLIGELTEALPARKIERFASKQFREENFGKYYIRNQNYDFVSATKRDFESWKEKIVGQFRMYYHSVTLKRLDLKSSKEFLIKTMESDLEELFKRVEDHNLPFVELYDELFSWYTSTRMRQAKQLLISNSKFNSYSPAVSIQILRKTSSLHPNLRLNYRFARKLFMGNPELKKLYHVPTNQAPLIPQSAPDIFKFLIWGARSKADQIFIRRMMKKKNPNSRFRLFSSINWALVYQLPAMSKNLEDYFEQNYLGKEYSEYIKSLAEERKALNQWPFANMDIINAASLNLELELIANGKK